MVGVWALFIAYSATLAVTEPAERSLIGDHADERERGTAYGLYPDALRRLARTARGPPQASPWSTRRSDRRATERAAGTYREAAFGELGKVMVANPAFRTVKA